MDRLIDSNYQQSQSIVSNTQNSQSHQSGNTNQQQGQYLPPTLIRIKGDAKPATLHAEPDGKPIGNLKINAGSFVEYVNDGDERQGKSKGLHLNILKGYNKWVKVRYAGQVGWVNSEKLDTKNIEGSSKGVLKGGGSILQAFKDGVEELDIISGSYLENGKKDMIKLMGTKAIQALLKKGAEVAIAELTAGTSVVIAFLAKQAIGQITGKVTDEGVSKLQSKREKGFDMAQKQFGNHKERGWIDQQKEDVKDSYKNLIEQYMNNSCDRILKHGYDLESKVSGLIEEARVVFLEDGTSFDQFANALRSKTNIWHILSFDGLDKGVENKLSILELKAKIDNLR